MYAVMNAVDGMYAGMNSWLKDDVKEEMVGVPKVNICAETDAGFSSRAGATENAIVGYWVRFVAEVFMEELLEGSMEKIDNG